MRELLQRNLGFLRNERIVGVHHFANLARPAAGAFPRHFPQADLTG
jgi:hypothetical protein